MLYLLFFSLSTQAYFAGCNNPCFENGCCCCTKKHDVKPNSDEKNNSKIGELQTRTQDKKIQPKENTLSLLCNDIKNSKNIRQGTSSNAENLLNIGQKVLTTNADTKSTNPNITTQPNPNTNTFNATCTQVKPQYSFPLKGLNNVGSTCYINAVLQCLLHINSLTNYFIYEYPYDKNNLNEKNKSIESHGKISEAFYEVVEGVTKGNEESYAPIKFKEVLGKCNAQFAEIGANDSKDLILYLMQTMHEELNYFGNIKAPILHQANQYDREATFYRFMNWYKTNNFSIISRDILGTYENVTLCHNCKKLTYGYQKFEFLSFGMYDYHNKKFNIYNGFEDISKPQQLKGENSFFCNTCKKLQDSEITSKIIQPPNYLLINIDYGKNKAFKPSQFDLNENLDITRFVCFDFGVPIKYRLIGVCTHLGKSGNSGHYIAYCKNNGNGKWYKFNDSTVTDENVNINNGNPYLLIYEKI